MFNSKITKRALISSVVSLVLCVAMLLGTTYAWFTASVTSTGNIIQAGTLKVSLEYANEAPQNKDDALWKDASQGAIFNYTKWEPGYADVKYIKVENEGNLALQYALTIVPNDATAAETDLAEVIDVYLFDGITAVTRADLATATPVATLADLIAHSEGAASGVLAETEYDAFTIVLKMRESAGNEYQGLSVGGGFSVHLLATQYTAESDYFDDQYDANAKLPMLVGAGSVAVKPQNTVPYYTIKVQSADTTAGGTLTNVATVVVPAAAVAGDATSIDVKVVEDVPQSQEDLRIEVDGKIQTFEVTVTGIVDGNDELIEVQLYVGKDKNVGQTVYHTLPDGTVEELVGTYVSEEGTVTFFTKSFSPFSVVVFDEPLPVVSGLPTATVEKLSGPQNFQWFASEDPENPFIINEGEDNAIKLVNPGELDVYYTFTADQTPEEAAKNEYATWKCDYFVMIESDTITSVGEDEIILGGQYAGYTVAFTPMNDVDTNTWIPLLLSMTNDGWTYSQIVSGVGTFICGVKGTEATAGATFRVQLRLVNPENDNDFKVVEEIVYPFAS